MENKVATVVINRERQKPELFVGNVIKRGNSHIFVDTDPLLNKTRHKIDQLGEWFAIKSKHVATMLSEV